MGLKHRFAKVLKSAAKVITRATYDTGSSVLLENLNWKSFEERRKCLKSIFIYKILNGHTAPNLKDAFCFDNERDDTHNLTNRETDLTLPMPMKGFGRRCFCYNAALHWNNFPNEAKIAESVNSFKSILNSVNIVISLYLSCFN